jgi:hypothetical protein
MGCSTPYQGAAAFGESVVSIGNEMMALHEPRRVVAYHDRSGHAFWLALIPSHHDPQALAALGIPREQQCPSSDLAVVAVGGTGPTQCVTLPASAVPNLRFVRKDGGATVQVILDLAAKGYAVADVK